MAFAEKYAMIIHIMTYLIRWTVLIVVKVSTAVTNAMSSAWLEEYFYVMNVMIPSDKISRKLNVFISIVLIKIQLILRFVISAILTITWHMITQNAILNAHLINMYKFLEMKSNMELGYVLQYVKKMSSVFPKINYAINVKTLSPGCSTCYED